MLIAQSRWDWDKALDAAGRAARGFAEQGADLDRLRALSYRCLALAGANHHEPAREAAAELLAEPGLDGDALCRALVSSSWVELPRGDQRQLAPLWHRLNDTLQRTDELAIWMECAPLGPLVGLPGMRAELLRYLDGARQRMPDHPTPLRSKCSVMQGWLDLFAGRVADAEGQAAAAADDARWLASPADLDAPCASLQAVLHALRGRRDLAIGLLESIIAKIEASGVRLRIDVYLSLYLFLTVRCAALLDDGATVRAVAPRLLAHEGSRRSWLSPAQTAGAAAHLAAAQGDLAGACAIWRRIVDDELHGDLYGQVAESRLRLADALVRGGAGVGPAAAALVPLFERVRDGGDWGAVLLAGPGVLRRLSLVPWGDALSADPRQRLADWARESAALVSTGGDDAASHEASWAGVASSPPGPWPVVGAPSPPAAPAAGMPLTSREMDVLSKIAAGDSNKVIARALELSPHTVKRHVANILDKLGLQSRGQAAAWYREHTMPR
jgi:LuxR family maltose regulon positive regulatory protein